MTTYDNTNRGVLFSERDKKSKDDDRPREKKRGIQ
jgi:hypothetical protein